MKLLIFCLGVVLLSGCDTSKPLIKSSNDTTASIILKSVGATPVKRVPVDVRGVSLDTDGDGVADYKDKELLTFTRCFPVDESGVGLCPEPDCCKSDFHIIDDFSCHIGSIEIFFAPGRNYTLNVKAKHMLDSLAVEMKANPYCILIVGTVAPPRKGGAGLSWDRVNAVIEYLVRQGISDTRFGFGYDMGDVDIVELRGTSYAEFPPAPSPPVKKKQ